MKILETESNYIDLFNTYWIFIDLDPPGSGRGNVGGGILGHGRYPTYMHAYIHMHMHVCVYMLKYTCIEIVNGHLHGYHV